VAVRPHIARVF